MKKFFIFSFYFVLNLLFVVKTLGLSIKPKQLSGNLSPNNLLQKAQFIRANGLKGPESIEFDTEGNLYTGLSSGRIVRLNSNNPSLIDRIYYTGEETNQDICSI